MDRLLKWTTWMCLWMLWPGLSLGLLPDLSGAAEVRELTQGDLIDIEAQPLPDLLRLKLTASQPFQMRHFSLKKPQRLVLDLTPCRLGIKQIPPIPEGLVTSFRFSQFNPSTTRVVLGLSQSTSFRIYPSAPDQRVWNVDLLTAQKATAPDNARSSAPAARVQEPKDKTTLNDYKKDKANAQKPASPAGQPARISFDFYNADLHNVFRLLGEVGQVNILVSDEVKGKVTVALKDMPWDQALDMVLTTNKLVKVQQGKTIRVTTVKDYIDTEGQRRKEEQSVFKADQEIYKAEQELLKTEEALQKVQEGRLPLLTKNFKLNYVDVLVVKKIIDEIWAKDPTKKEKGIASGISQTNTLFVRAPRNDMDHIERLIKACDQPTAQVMIEARIVEADASFTRDLGLSWGGNYAWANPYAPLAGTVRGESGPAGSNTAVNLPMTNPAGATFGGIGLALAGANFNLDVRLQAMEQQGKGKTISSPKIVTLDNKRATIKQGQKVPITTQTTDKNYVTTYIDAALVLAVTPHISSNQKKITLQVSVQKNEPNFAEKDTLGNPAIFTKEADTEMTVNNGDTVVIGGIIFKKEQVLENKIPWLGDIPVLGWLFKTEYRNYQDTELLIFLTPKVVTPLAERGNLES